MTRRTGRSLLSWAGVLLLMVGWAAFLRPQFLGGSTTFVGVSGVSMTPTMHDGDLAVVRTRSRYDVGDVIAFRIPAGQPGAGNNIIHRIVGGDAERGFATRGDYNPGDDIWRPTGDDVIGEVTVHLPGVAGWFAQLRRPGVLAAVVGSLVFVLVAWPPKLRRTDDPETVPVMPAPQVPAVSVPFSVAGVTTAVLTTAALAVGALQSARPGQQRRRRRGGTR